MSKIMASAVAATRVELLRMAIPYEMYLSAYSARTFAEDFAS